MNAPEMICVVTDKNATVKSIAFHGKAFDADSYEHKDDLDGDADDAALSAISEDQTEVKRPPFLTMCQQVIENLEADLPGLEPDDQEWVEEQIEMWREAGRAKYPDEDFGGEETAAETAPSADEEREFAEEVAGAYRESPEEREGAKRARINVQKSLRALRKGDGPAVLDAAATAHDAISRHPVGRTITKAEKEAHAEHAKNLWRLHGAVTHGMKAETESDEEQSIGALSASMPMDDDDEAAHEVEKLFGPVVRRAVAKQLQATAAVASASEKHLETLLERIGNVYGLRME